MGHAQDFHDLLKYLALTPEEILQRLEFLDWSHIDGERLQQDSFRVLPKHKHFLDLLYNKLGEFPVTSSLLVDSNTVQRLKHNQSSYYQRLWQGPYNAEYTLDRLRIGWVHQKAGLELEWYLGAYRLYLHEMLNLLLGDNSSSATFASLLKAVFFDISLAVDTYTTAQRKALEESEARYARALRGANDGVWEWHIDQDSLYCSERWANMLGLSQGQLKNSSESWFALVHPDDLSGLRFAIEAHLSGHSNSLHHEYRIRRQDNSYLWVLVRGIAEQVGPNERRITGSQTDISAYRLMQEKLQYAARHDPLTGLYNRDRLQELLSTAIQRQGRKGARETALLFIDLDRFKLINDSLGHRIGDQVLQEVAHRLKNCLRPDDHLIRFGGDEFVVLLEDLADKKDTEWVAQRILDSLIPPIQMQQHLLMVSASIGIATLDDTNVGLDPLQAADMALYRAKSAGKAQFAHYSEELQNQAQRQLQLQNELTQALARNEFVLYYQPICNIDSQPPELIGVESLLRWQRQGKIIPPTEFIPSLEESGAIIAVGEWVLEQACRQTRAWQLAGHTSLRCSVNLSSRQLQQADLAGRVQHILQSTGLAASSLVLELTESQLMEDSVPTLACLRELADLGIQLALDDFGTGYSSLGYLKRFPLHILKVDKSFISATPGDSDTQVISRAIIGLGQSLGLEVIAEGVENQGHLSYLRSLHCRLSQGYLFSRPIPAAEMQQLLDSKKRFSDSDESLIGPRLP